MSDHYTISVHSPTWIVIDRELRKEIAAANDALAVRGTDIANTEYVRGRLSAFREILDLGKTDPE